MEKYDYIVVGAGLAGAILARKLADEKNKKVLILERRNHIAGNTYDYNDSRGITVQKYGPHVFHTNSDEAFRFISKYCETIPYITQCEAVIDNISTPSPFNFLTIDQFYNSEDASALKDILLKYYKGRKQVTVVEMLESSEGSIKQFAQFLFEKDYKLYTAKQWNLMPSEIDPSVLKRVPIVLSYRDTYFDDKYEVMPKEGFEAFFKALLNHPNISVQLNEDALQHIEIDANRKLLLFDGKKINLIYTGAIDELFGYLFGTLPYRSLHFELKSIKRKSFQNAAIVAYPQVEGYTRITEYTKMPVQKDKEWTSIAYEYPVAYDKHAKVGNEPYYPVLTENSHEMYERYRIYSEEFSNLILCGRLADFKYYNMDQVILRAFEVYRMMED